jgi:hypothetical protein
MVCPLIEPMEPLNQEPQQGVTTPPSFTSSQRKGFRQRTRRGWEGSFRGAEANRPEGFISEFSMTHKLSRNISVGFLNRTEIGATENPFNKEVKNYLPQSHREHRE